MRVCRISDSDSDSEESSDEMYSSQDSTSTEEDEEEATALFPAEILTHILSFLPPKDVLSSRVVSKKWSDCADITFRRTVLQQFKKTNTLQTFPTRLSQRVLVNFDIAARKELKAHVKKLFETEGNNVKFLFIQSANESYQKNKELAMVRYFLTNAPKIETLHLDTCFYSRKPNPSCKWFANPKMKLNCLKRLEIERMDFIRRSGKVSERDDEELEVAFKWINDLVRVAPNVSQLIIKEDDYLSPIVEANTGAYERLLQFPKLEYLEITEVCLPVLQAITNCPNLKLKSLVINEIAWYCIHYNHLELLQEVLEMQPSLEFLKMSINVRDRDPDSSFVMPKMPNLKELDIHWDDSLVKMKRRDGDTERFGRFGFDGGADWSKKDILTGLDLLKLKDVFTDEDTFEEKFPKLEALSLTFCEGYNKAMYEAILPPADTAFSTLPQIKTLKVNYPGEILFWMEEDHYDNEKIEKYRKRWMKKLKRIFPSVKDFAFILPSHNECC